MLQGSITALVTPFRDGSVDWKAFEGLIDRQLEAGTQGLVLCGTTGESPTLTADEHNSIIRRGIAQVRGRIPVIAGTGTNSTAETIALSKHAKESKADGVLVVTPYYNKPTQEGLYYHYKAVAESVDIPLLIYNIPGRCVVDMTAETMGRLARIPNIVGVKDATGQAGRVVETREACGPDFIQLCGEDAEIFSFMSQGGHGCISVTSNVAPALCARFHQAWREGKAGEAGTLHERLMPLHRALFVETSPAPVKYALSALGQCTDEMRLPLVCASEKARRAVDEALARVGLSATAAASPSRAAG